MSKDLPISAIQPFSMLDFPGKTSCIVFLAGCNFRCPYCHNSEFVLPEKINEIKDSFIEKKSLFAFLKARQGLLDGVVITGGEPTIHKNLPEFIQKIKKMGFLVKLDTNGTNPDMLRQLLKANLLDYIAMDIKSSEKTYNKAVGVKINIEIIKKSIKIIQNSNLDYEFRTTLVPGIHNEDIFKELLELIQGAKKYYLQNFRPTGGCLDPKIEKINGFNPLELKNFQKIAEKAVKHCEIRAG